MLPEAPVTQADLTTAESADSLEPRIIPRAEHNISRRDVDPEALKVLYRLHNQGYLAYLVGGGVRDLLLGRRPKDFDVGTDAPPGQIRRLFGNSRVIGRRFRLVQVFFRGGKIIEVSTFRRTAEETDGDEVLGANNTYGTPAQDALRRDLTINALFYNIADFSVVDYVGGLKDLRAGLIRAVGDPQVRFHRDPVRVLRAVRHAARTGFTLTPETRQAVEAHAQELALCPSSRVRDELMRDLKGGAAAAWLELAHDTRVLYCLLPSLEAIYGPPDSAERVQAAGLLAKLDQALAAGQAPPEPVILAALLWPALEAVAQREEFPPGRAGRVQWSLLVRRALPELAQAVSFPKRVVERACQIGGLMGFVRYPLPDQRLPKKVRDKGYFAEACTLAGLLGHDLKALDGPGARPSKKRRRRRRRRRPHRSPAAAA
ncbi:MAG: poly(A) polymerase [Desulfarculus sp.]|nr:MAG: poly(A) polymerase [Desulfarculus sp.]